MEKLDPPGPEADERERYEPPCIEDVAEFETTALAACAKLTPSFLCNQPPGLMSS
jgi:hypothetical protein